MHHLLLGTTTLALTVLLMGCPTDEGPLAGLPACNPLERSSCTDQASAARRAGDTVNAEYTNCLPTSPTAGVCVRCRNDLDCQDRLFCNGRERCDGFLGCLPAEASAPVPACSSCEVCDEGSDMCLSSATDSDGDGAGVISCGGTDCDDDDARRFPGNAEVCDSRDHDEDCDPTTYGVRDADGDGSPDARCCNTDVSGRDYCGEDCDDARPGVHPDLAESCDQIDNDCDGSIDETVTADLYTDADGDGWGVGEAERLCSGQMGYAVQGGDCDEANPQLHPGAFRCAGSGSDIHVCDSVGDYVESTCPGDGQCVEQPDGTGVCWPGTVTECADSDDNDGDGLVDTADSDCTSASDTSERPERCGDSLDNDGDRLIDYPNDPGCASRDDTNETDPSTLPACANGLDDDGDGTADYNMGRGDLGCSSASDDSERDLNGPQCDNGINDDGDTLTDFPKDPKCSGPRDNIEGTPACSNGLDDDGDGWQDYVVNGKSNDPGCISANDDDERGVPPNAPLCDNGLDDDGDGAIDYPGDLGCLGPASTNE